MLAGLHEDLAVSLAEAVENPAADDERLEIVEIVELGDVFLPGIVEFQGPEAAVVIALAVHEAGLERVARHGPRHGHGDGAEGPVGLDHHEALRHADAQALHVVRAVDGTLAVGEVAVAVIGPGEDAQAGLFRIAVEQFRRLARGAAHHGLLIGEEIGQRHHAEAAHHGREIAHAAEHHAEPARLDAVELEGLVRVQPAAVGELDVDLPLAGPGHIVLEGQPEHAHF